jgi:hypothetical protein
MSLDDSVDTMSRWVTVHPRDRGSISVSGNRFISSTKLPGQLWVSIASYIVDIKRFPSGIKSVGMCS